MTKHLRHIFIAAIALPLCTQAASTRISALPDKPTPDGNDVIPVIQADGTPRKVTVSSIRAPLQTAINAKEDAIAADTSGVTKFWNQSKAWQALNAAAVGLGNVNNTSDASKPVSTAQAAADTAVANAAASALASHTGNTANPHNVTKAQVGLANVDNTSDAAKPISTATQTALDAKANSAALTAHTSATSNPHSVTKAQVGLANVDNTSDAAKPVSTAQATAIATKADTTDARFNWPKFATTDRIVWCLVGGNDGNDGLSPGTAKATVNAAYNTVAAAGGGTVKLGFGVFTATSTITIKNHVSVEGVGRFLTRIQSPTGSSLFTVPDSVQYANFRDVRLQAGPADDDLIHIVASTSGTTDGGTMGQCQFERVSLGHQNPNAHIIYAPDTPNFVEVRFWGCEISGQLSHTVPLIHIVSSNNGVNVNSIENCRINQTGNYAIVFDSTSGSGYCNDNVFRNINMEQTQGGAIKILAGNNNLIENVVGYDEQTDLAHDWIYIGKSSTTAMASTNNTIRNTGRRGGSFAIGSPLVDIKLETGKALNPTIENFNTGTGTGPRIDLGNNSGAVLRGLLANSTITNAHASTIRYGVDGKITFGEDTALARSGTGLLTVNSLPLVIETMQAISTDADTSIANNVSTVSWNVALGGNRVLTLPLANSVAAGHRVQFVDRNRIGPFRISIARAGSDTINGGTGNFDITTPNAVVDFVSDGASRWTATPMTPIVHQLGNSNTTMAAGRDAELLTVTFTAPRIITLPLASSYPAGRGFKFVDVVGGVSSTNTASFARAGSDTINGGTAAFVVSIPFAVRDFVSDGVSNWTVAAVTQQGNVFNGPNQLLQADGSGKLPGANLPTADIQAFPSNGTWTKPSFGSVTTIYVIGGGSGGGSGAVQPSGTAAGGGGGGAAGSHNMRILPTALLTSTVSVGVGTGGAGGAAVSSNATNGAAGGQGNASTFGSYVRTGSATGGGGGTTSGGTAGTTGTPTMSTGSGSSGSTATAATAVVSSMGGGGGGGAGLAATPASAAGGTGAASGSNSGTGGVAGTSGGGNGGNGSAQAIVGAIGGSGGGGGGSNAAGNGGSGGNGSNYGAGGGGGAGANDGSTSGAGGNGSPGIVVVITQ